MSANILLVDDDPGAIQLLGRILSGSGNLRFATNGVDAIRLTREAAPDVMLLDAEMPGMSGFQVCKALKAEDSLVDFPVIFVTSHSEAAFEVAGFEIGAADFIAKPVSASLVRARVDMQLRAKHRADELRRNATTDVLTGIANRRQFGVQLDKECRRAQRSGEPVALLMIDVDHFKPFNDRYGHMAGDACLRAVAEALTGICMRPGDLVARFGGEEFVLLLPQTPRRGAEHVAQRVLDAIEALAIAHDASPTSNHVTVSVGVACYDEQSTNWRAASSESRFIENTDSRAFPTNLIQAADFAMYAAKHAGRAHGKLVDVANVLDERFLRDVGSPPVSRLAMLSLSMPGALTEDVAAFRSSAATDRMTR